MIEVIPGNMKITFLDAATLGDISFAPIESLGDLVCWQTSSPEQAIERVTDCDVLIINKIKVTPELIDAASNLKLICEAATGVNNIDLEYAAKKGIPVRNVAGYSTESVVQSTFMHILNLIGHLPYYDAKVKSGRYSWSGLFTDVSLPFFELDGKTMGIVGMGTIGKRVAQVACAFGMKVIYYSTSGTSHCTDYPSVSLEELMSVSIPFTGTPVSAGMPPMENAGETVQSSLVLGTVLSMSKNLILADVTSMSVGISFHLKEDMSASRLSSPAGETMFRVALLIIHSLWELLVSS